MPTDIVDDGLEAKAPGPSPAAVGEVGTQPGVKAEGGSKGNSN